jgi:hypothetical protein
LRSRSQCPEPANQVDDSRYDEVKQLGRKVLKALDIGTSATHMEWFFGPKGLQFSEIGCRPPGVMVWDLYSEGNDLDLYREWAQLLVHGQTHSRASRHYASGMIALRPDQDGRITGYDGLDEVRRRYRELIIDDHFPPIGTATQPPDAGYMANAWMRVKHPSFDALRGVMDDIGERVQVRAR